MQLARLVSRFKPVRRKRFKLLGVVVLVVVGLFELFCVEASSVWGAECGSLGGFRNASTTIDSGHLLRIDYRGSSSDELSHGCGS